MSLFAIGLLGLSTGFASAVWVISGWTSARVRHWWLTFSYSSLAVVNILSTVVLASNLSGNPITLPSILTLALLVILIAMPAAIQAWSWRIARKAIAQVVSQ